MVDIVITPADVVAGSNASTVNGTAGETIVAGKMVYKNSTTNKFALADSNSVTAEARTPLGMALNGASLNQPLVVQKGGDVTVSAVLTPGVAVYLSDTPGGLCLVADVGAGEFSTIVGIAESASVMQLGIQASGVAL
jgi:hypothetical protein